jgi:tetratricopeptide (TPR) repeat protein
LSELVRYSLLDYDEKTARYRLHDLARVFADSRLTEAEREHAQYRHAERYNRVLAAANQAFLEGGEGVLKGLALFDLERSNITAGQAWAAARAEADERAAQLCSSYPDSGVYVLNLRQHARDRVGWLEAALKAARRLKNRPAEGVHLGNLGLAYAALGEPRRAIEYHEQALTIDRAIGDRRGEGAALGNLGNAYAALGEPRRAIEYYEQRLTIAREIGDRRGEGNALWNTSLALRTLNEPETALAMAREALRIFEEIEHPGAAMVRQAVAEWEADGQTSAERVGRPGSCRVQTPRVFKTLGVFSH